jgi:transposase
MFFPEARVRVLMHGRAVDLRRSFTGPIAPTRQGLGQDPLSGHLLCFVNRRGDYLKVLYRDRTGFCL